MAYGIQYRTEYRRFSGGITTIDFLQLDVAEASPIVNLVASGNPLEITTTGDVNNIFQPTIGTGANINLLVTPLSTLGFFTSNPQEWLVNIYDGVSGSTLVWQGFINAEIYSEDYSTSRGMPITLQCNDGMALLDHIKYKDGANNYSGFAEYYTIIDNILDKLATSYVTIYTSNDITINSVGPVTNPFLYLTEDNENFINEKLEAMSCREVLDSIIGGLGLSMRFKGPDIYIIDPINLHTVAKGKSYSRATFGSEAQYNVGGYLDISNKDIKWYKTGTTLDIVPAMNEISIKYDPYNFNDITYDFSDEDNCSTDWDTWVDMTGWWVNAAIEYTGWTYSDIDMGTAIKEEATDTPLCFIVLSDSDETASYTFSHSNLTQDSGIQLKVSFEVYIQTKEDGINIYEDVPTYDIQQVQIPLSIKVGDKYWKSGNVWETTEDGAYLQAMFVRQEGVDLADVTDSRINDTWTTASIIVPLGIATSEVLIQGGISIKILDTLRGWAGAVGQQILPVVNEEHMQRIFIREVKVEILNTYTGENVGNNGVEEKAILSTNLTGKQGKVIKTTTGIGTCGASRGSLKTDSQTAIGTNITGLYRGAGGTLYTTSELTLQSFMSQYQRSRYKLSGWLNSVDYTINLDMKLIQDLTYLPDKSFYIVSSIYNDRKESTSVTMIEITDTREDIT